MATFLNPTYMANKSNMYDFISKQYSTDVTQVIKDSAEAIVV